VNMPNNSTQRNSIEITNEITTDDINYEQLSSIIDIMNYKVREAEVIFNGINIGTLNNGEFVFETPPEPKETKPEKKFRAILKLRRPEKP